MGIGGISLWQLIILLLILLPSVYVLVSGRSHGGAKFGWFIVALLLSWIGLAVFLIVTQKEKTPSEKGSDQESALSGGSNAADTPSSRSCWAFWLGTGK